MALDHIQITPDQEENFNLSTLPEILRIRAQQVPERIALIYLRDGFQDEEKMTYKQLFDDAFEIALKLTHSNYSGERALMFYPPGLSFVKALFGCFLAGVIAVPAYPPRKNRSLDRIMALVKDSGARLVLSTDEIRRSTERSFSDVSELQELRWISTSQYTDRLPDDSNNISPDSKLLYSPDPGDIALLQYTSGSTGKPKGVMVTHRNFICNLEFLKQAFEISSETIAVHWLPVFHDMGLVFGVMEPVYSGYTGILMPPVSFIQTPSRWLQAISRYKATLAGAPNFAYDLCVSGISDDECKDLDLSHLRTLYNGAEPVRKKTLETFSEKFKPFGFRPEMFYPTYGMAEATLILSGGNPRDIPSIIEVDKIALEKNRIRLTDAGDINAYSLVSVGWPRIDTKIIIVNPDTFESCPEDEVGEIWVSGSIVTAGYWNKPEETKAIFSAEIKGEEGTKYLRTGDLGFFHKGELFISGRLKDLIILRGRNYYPQDIEYFIENCYNSLRANASAAFSVTIDDVENLVIVAEVERTAIRDLNVEEVCNAIRIKISEEMELSVYAIQLLRTASILKTSSGKIQRKACREAFLNKSLEVVGESILEEEKNENERSVKETAFDLTIIQAWLMTWIHIKLKISLERIDLSKPLVVYGLNSMKAIRLQQDFLDKFGVNFPPYLFFEKISLKDLTERAHKLIQENS
jgi:acyl-CoA synthetase (AMP-forming)/AMP-acid ligase II